MSYSVNKHKSLIKDLNNKDLLIAEITDKYSISYRHLTYFRIKYQAEIDSLIRPVPRLNYQPVNRVRKVIDPYCSDEEDNPTLLQTYLKTTVEGAPKDEDLKTSIAVDQIHREVIKGEYDATSDLDFIKNQKSRKIKKDLKNTI